MREMVYRRNIPHGWMPVGDWAKRENISYNRARELAHASRIESLRIGKRFLVVNAEAKAVSND